MPGQQKKQRTSRACDFCHRRSIRCRPSTEESDKCQNCSDYGLTCAFNRPVKKRGLKPSASSPSSQHRGTNQHDPQDEIETSSAGAMSSNLRNDSSHGEVSKDVVEADGLFAFSLQAHHRGMVLKGRDVIDHLTNVYLEVVYPIFPFFHRPSLREMIANRSYLLDQSLFAAIMAMCALASARVRDGATSTIQPGSELLSSSQYGAEAFFQCAKAVLPQTLAGARRHGYVKAYVFLALYGVQQSSSEIMHQYLGLYHSLMALHGLHDEKNWSSELGIIETEERRRLFWSTYTLEVYCSIVWSGIIRCRESQSHVLYPVEVADELFSDAGFVVQASPTDPSSLVLRAVPNSPVDPSCWLHGWNFTTELYRVLEHAMNEVHRRRPRPSQSLISTYLASEQPSNTVVLDQVLSMYRNLPTAFLEARPMVNVMAIDIFSYQSANITATIQLLKLVLLTARDASADQMVVIANELLLGLSKVPVAFLRAISSPLLYHLAGIGSILGQIMVKGPLSESAYLQVRTALSNMAELLAGLEHSMARHVGASTRLRTLISGIDHYMDSQRQQEVYASLSPEIYGGSSSIQVVTHPSRHGDMSVGRLLTYANESYDQAPQQQWDSSFEPSSIPAQSTTAGSSSIRQNDQAEFQIPPELLENWPWPLDQPQDSYRFPDFTMFDNS